MKWIGLTGGIATGKSSAKKLIEGLGYPVIDADELARFVIEPVHQGYQQVLLHFGNSILHADQSINRLKLGEIIFNSTEKRLLLESILHPLIHNEVQLLKKKYKEQKNLLCFYDVPLLFEKKLQAQFFCTILIWCDEQIQLARLKARNHFAESQALSRIRSQMQLCDKLPLADFCIDNSTDLSSLELQIKNLVQKLVSQSDSSFVNKNPIRD